MMYKQPSPCPYSLPDVQSIRNCVAMINCSLIMAQSIRVCK